MATEDKFERGGEDMATIIVDKENSINTASIIVTENTEVIMNRLLRSGTKRSPFFRSLRLQRMS